VDASTKHGVWFNRAPSRAEVSEEFGNKPPQDINDPKDDVQWLSRGLLEAVSLHQ